MKEKIISWIFDGAFKLPLRYINMLCYYIIPFFLFIVLGIMILGNQNISHFGKELGGNAWFVFLMILFVKPLAQIFSDIRIFTKLLVLRRQLGVIMLWLFLGHYVIMAYSLGFEKIFSSIQSQGFASYLLWGILGGWIILFLGITSNTKSVKFLKKNWKRLHSLVYPALLFIALHIYFIKHDISPFIIILICNNLSGYVVDFGYKIYYGYFYYMQTLCSAKSFSSFQKGVRYLMPQCFRFVL